MHEVCRFSSFVFSLIPVVFLLKVRVNALLCLGDLVPKLDKQATIEILQTIQRCTAVDRSAPMLMCTLGVANSMLKQVRVRICSPVQNALLQILVFLGIIVVFTIK